MDNTRILGIKKDKLLLYALILPAVLFVLIVTIYPLVCTFIYSFQDFKLTNPNEKTFIGLQNYIATFQDSATVSAIFMDIKFTAIGVSASIVVGLSVALIANSLGKTRNIFRVIFSMPMLLSSVVVGVMWKFLLNNELGVINYLLSSIGLGKPGWLDTAGMAQTTVIIVDVWQWSAYVFILTLAGLESQPMEPIESARIDGANAFQIFRYITLPGILPVIKVAVMFRIIWTFRSFDLIFSLTRGGPGYATETLALSIWRTAFEKYQIGVASAQSVIMFILLLCASMVLIRSMYSKNDD